jgi:hypothetical protein
MERHSICLAIVAALGHIASANAQIVERHELTVAANSSLLVSNTEVDSIIGQMNQIMTTGSYPWDVPCPVQFVRKGAVQSVSNLALTGTYEVLAQDLRLKAPGANVMVVSTIDCNGIGAAGCGNVGSEPIVAGSNPGFDAQLWLHERGHNVGLYHSAEGLPDSAYPQNIGMRFMFWQLGVGHVGKIASECMQYSKTLFASTITVHPAAVAASGPSAIPGTVDVTSEHSASHATPIAAAAAAAAAAPAAGAPDGDGELNALAEKAHLTVAAFRVVGPPWVDRMPLDQIKKLTAADLGSIRDMLKGTPNQYWPQAMQALAVVGNDSDVKLMKRALNLPLPAIAPGTTLDAAAIAQTRSLLKIKLTAPTALGILANRTQSTAAVDSLWDTVDLKKAHEVIGPAAAESLSKSALTGLSIANTPKDQQYLDLAMTPQAAVPPGHVVPPPPASHKEIVPLSIEEIQHLKNTSLAIKNLGLEAYVKGEDSRT